jgi:head-tail adaptor
MRATQELAMPGTVVIERVTNTSNGRGGYTQTWAAVGTVNGRIYPRRTQGIEIVTGGQIVSDTDWWGTLPTGTDVLAQDRLLYQTRTWEVVRVNNDEMYQTAVRCELTAFNEERRA